MIIFLEITDDTCKTESTGLNVEVKEDQIYAGTVTKTIEGDECVKWSEVSNSHYEDDHNFCRSTWRLYEGKPWCYTKTVKEGNYWGHCSCSNPTISMRLF